MRSLKADFTGYFLGKTMNKKMGRKLPTNSYQSEAPSEVKAWGDGHIKINDIAYGTTYPNSYLDLYLPSKTDIKEKHDKKHPILIYAHGGGFIFCGKSFGDAIVHMDEVGKNENSKKGVSGIFQDFLNEGIAVASLEYAMAPKYRFPIPVIQMNEAIAYLKEHAVDYNLDMDQIILMGGSAGADMVELYATVVSVPEYAKKLGIEKVALNFSQVSCAVVDESALINYAETGNNLLLMQLWLGECDVVNTEIARLSYVPDHIEDKYPPCFINSCNAEQWFYDSTYALYEKLCRIGSDVEFYYPPIEKCVCNHGYMMDYATNEISKECYDKMMCFVKQHIHIKAEK